MTSKKKLTNLNEILVVFLYEFQIILDKVEIHEIKCTR